MTDSETGPARLESLEREILAIKVDQTIGNRAFVTEKARADFRELILRSAKITPDGAFGRGGAPLAKFVENEYNQRTEMYAPRPTAPKQTAPTRDPQSEADLDEINPRASKETLDRAWRAIQKAWPSYNK